MKTSPPKIATMLGSAAHPCAELPADAAELAPPSITGHARTQLPTARIGVAPSAAGVANWVLDPGGGWHTIRATSLLAVKQHWPPGMAEVTSGRLPYGCGRR